MALRSSVRTCFNDADTLKNPAVISYVEKRFPNDLVFVRHSGDNIQTTVFCDVAQVLLPHTGQDAHIKACRTLATKRTKKKNKPVGFKNLSYAAQLTSLAVFLPYFSPPPPLPNTRVSTFCCSCYFIVPRGRPSHLGLFLT